MPFLTALDCGQGNVTVVRKGSVGGIRPADNPGHITHHLPVRKQDLNLFGIGQFQAPQQEPRRLKLRGDSKKVLKGHWSLSLRIWQMIDHKGRIGPGGTSALKSQSPEKACGFNGPMHFFSRGVSFHPALRDLPDFHSR